MTDPTRRLLAPKKVIAIYRAWGKGKDIAARFNVCPATVSHIKYGDRHYKITAPLRVAEALSATLVSMACGVDL